MKNNSAIAKSEIRIMTASASAAGAAPLSAVSLKTALILNQLSLRLTAISTASWLRRAAQRSEYKKGNTMKTTILTLLALTIGISALNAQNNTKPTPQTAATPRSKVHPPLVITTLDSNGDG